MPEWTLPPFYHNPNPFSTGGHFPLKGMSKPSLAVILNAAKDLLFWKHRFFAPLSSDINALRLGFEMPPILQHAIA